MRFFSATFALATHG